MGGMIATVLGGLASNRRARRRARNLRAGSRTAPVKAVAAERSGQARPQTGPRVWIGVAALALAIGGGILIAHHARTLAAAAGNSAGNSAGSGLVRELDGFQPALPGLAFSVPAQAGVSLNPQGGGALLVVAGMRAERPVVIDLCEQMLDRASGRISPVRVGYPFADVARWAARNETAASPITLRNVVLASGAMPQLDIAGNATGGAPLRLSWSGAPAARWIGDLGAGAIHKGGEAKLGRQGWLVWGDAGALRVMRRASAACPAAGELVLQRWLPATGPVPAALVAAFPAQGELRTAMLAPGEYRVPAKAAPRLEDGALFDSLRERGLIRLAPSGLIEVAPRDLARWRTAEPGQRTGDLHSWDGVVLDAAGLKLLERLHHRADGAYVLEQVRVFNSERRLLAWRLRPNALGGSWQASAGPVAVGASTAMPLAAARLFERLPHGWEAWSRVADWPAGAQSARLALVLPQPARGGERIELMLAGRMTGIGGAELVDTRPACGGRACTRPDDVRELVLALQPGARRVVLEAAPLDMANLGSAGDAAYRHLALDGRELRWQPLPDASRVAPAAPVPVLLADRNGAPLWQGGRALEAAHGAGLGTLLGLREGHANSIAGMLGRLPAPNGRPHAARLTLDLALQGAAQGALDCVGLRRGQWDGARCSGGAAPAPGRQAGLVLLDTGSGDILAAASAQAGAPASSAPWSELRDFDRVDPARSPLRQAALQHDGGAERSPGSTYKIVSALGLELAAQANPRLDALLDGMPLAAINGTAARGGYAFRTDAASYPLGSAAHITNFRDQHLDRRAQDGKLGLAQALTYSLNTWFAWTAELGDRSLLGKPEGGAPSLRALDGAALDAVRPSVAMARRLGFERPLHLDGGLLPGDYAWRNWDALQASVAASDPVGSRHELRQMAIGLRMQATPLHMALAAGAVGEGRAIAPRLLLELDGAQARSEAGARLGVRLDRIRAGLRGVVAHGTAAGAFRAPEFDGLRAGLYGKTGTAPVGDAGLATVWFTGWLEPGSLPGQDRRLAFAAFVSRSEATGGEHAAPVVAALLRSMLAQKPEQKGN
ncbi:penicillin-binding transpeptidase domain-containing protein [Massilia sp. IC2-278]|uniref:penicillin-binding transpeptidase domain-containing protein n=1 Tax=Massilia sp. IC2-278 TaxID=2887200 RepID=UPI00226C97FC|nr:penicillin-binding transpeptidase domain-containing protein [Massilia sp. IC2-278]